MSSPVTTRVALSGTRTPGRFSVGGVTAFCNMMIPAESFSAFMRWREDPITSAFLSALRDLAITPPAGYVSPSDVRIQFGVQSGLTLAATLADDPTALYPFLFTGSATSGGAARDESDATSYSVAPDARG